MFMDEDQKANEEVLTLILIKMPTLLQNGFGTQYQILIPEGFGIQTFRRLVYSGCRAIAVKEQMAIHMECGKRCFPYDYPETEAGQNWLKTLSEANVKEYTSKPPSKRVNYQKINVKHAFGRQVSAQKGRYSICKIETL